MIEKFLDLVLFLIIGVVASLFSFRVVSWAEIDSFYLEVLFFATTYYSSLKLLIKVTDYEM